VSFDYAFVAPDAECEWDTLFVRRVSAGM
jgi:hypothetical protein